MRISKQWLWAAWVAAVPAAAQPLSVSPVRETTRTTSGSPGSTGDVALWVNPQNREDSLILGTDTVSSLLLTYNLDGSQREVLSQPLGSLDVRNGFPAPEAGAPRALIAGANAGAQLTFFTLDPARLDLVPLLARTVGTAPSNGTQVALFRSPRTGNRFFAFVALGSTIRQVELALAAEGRVEISAARTLTAPGNVFGLAVDDAREVLFANVEGFTLYRFDADPQAASDATLIEDANADSRSYGDLAVYATSATAGYLVVSDQATSAFIVYDRVAPHARRGSFQLVADGGVDAVNAPRMAAVTAQGLGRDFPAGLFVGHDSASEQGENFKLARWEAVAQAFTPALTVDAQPEADGGNPDGGEGGGVPNPPNIPHTPRGPSELPASQEARCGRGATGASAALFAALGFGALASRRRRR